MHSLFPLALQPLGGLQRGDSQSPAPTHTRAEEDAGVPELKAKQLCVIAFLPDILDSGAAGRNDAIEVGDLWVRGGAVQ